MTIPNERLLLVESDLDLAIEQVFDVMKATDSGQIADISHVIGVAGIRSFYNWARHHARYGLSAEMKWKRGHKVRSESYARADELQRVSDLIDQISERSEESVLLSGTLVGVDQSLKTFHMIPPQGGEIKGYFAEGFSFAEPVMIPSFIQATLIKYVFLHYSIEKEETRWELQGLL